MDDVFEMVEIDGVMFRPEDVPEVKRRALVEPETRAVAPSPLQKKEPEPAAVRRPRKP